MPAANAGFLSLAYTFNKYSSLNSKLISLCMRSLTFLCGKSLCTNWAIVAVLRMPIYGPNVYSVTGGAYGTLAIFSPGGAKNVATSGSFGTKNTAFAS